MNLTASPFHPQTGELLPVYRDAYLRADLSPANTRAVDAYLKLNAHRADEILRRYYQMKQDGEQVRPVGWVQRQFELLRTQPQRLRRRAATLVAGAALVGGAVFAGSDLPMAGVEAAGLRMRTVQGRILGENGQPLVGATVLLKGTPRGVSTNAQGEYTLLVPADRPSTLAYGYGGYESDEVQVRGGQTENVTLVPRDEPAHPKKAKRWLLF